MPTLEVIIIVALKERLLQKKGKCYLGTLTLPFALKHLSDNGILICDNAESYDFYELLKDSQLYRVDFFGSAPGVLLPHATSIYFQPTSFIFNPNYPIPNIAYEL